MELALPIREGLSLLIATDPKSGDHYPTARLRKGLILVHEGMDLSEEGVGFGVPIIKQGLRTIFPGSSELFLSLKDSIQEVTVIFTLNLEERMIKRDLGTLENQLIYNLKNYLAALIRRMPVLRGFLTSISNTLREILGWKTIYTDTGLCAKVKMIYSIDSRRGKIMIEYIPVDLPRDHVTEVVVMNEQGARFFDHYQDSDGNNLIGNAIGCWDEVFTNEASFSSETQRLLFTLGQVKGAQLFRGRELVNNRLAWAGFGYCFPPINQSFAYEIRIDKFQ